MNAAVVGRAAPAPAPPADGGLPGAEIVSATYGVEDAPAAFAAAALGTAGKVVVAPGR